MLKLRASKLVSVLLVTLSFLLLAPLPRVQAAGDFDSLSAAIRAANSGTVSSTITLSADITLSAALTPITGDVTIDGAGHSINGAEAFRIFDVNGGTLRLKHVTLTEGKAGHGGAIRLRNGARVVVEESTLSANHATNGGAIATSSSADRLTISGSRFLSNKADKNAAAIYANGGTIDISDSVFEKNCGEIASHEVSESLRQSIEERSVDGDGCLHVAYKWPDPADISPSLEGNGGAIRLLNGAQVSIESATFSKNKGINGGAIAVTSGSARLFVSGSSFSRSFAERDGGAIYIDGGTADIRQSSFLDNNAKIDGGALLGATGEIDVVNSTFYNNRAAARGGVLAVWGADVTVTHVTMISNAATAAGGAIQKGEGSVKLRNSIIAKGGAGDDCAGGLDQMAGNLSADGTCALLPGDDPLLGPLSGEPARFPLMDFSPAVDRADPEYCLDVDQLGMARPQGGGCDIGAIESMTALPEPTPVVPPPPCPLALQIIAANTDAPAGGCPAESGHDVISLTGDIILDEKLPNISSDITLEGNGYTISGNNRRRIFTVDAGMFTVNKVTLAEGKATFADNDKGGAIRVEGRGRIAVKGVTFRNNSSIQGGAIGGESNGGRSSITESRFVSNEASAWGGAIDWSKGSSLQVSNSSFHKNAAPFGDGGAIGTLGGTIAVSNSTFTSNRARRGGAVYARWGAVTLTHVTMLNNIASDGGGLMAEDRGFASGIGVVRLRNSLLAGGNWNDCGGRLAENVGNYIADGSCSPKLSGDPLIAEAAEGSEPEFLELLPGSPAIDAADPRYCLRSDQRGRERPPFSLCDIGAIESIPVAADVGDCTVTTTHGLTSARNRAARASARCRRTRLCRRQRGRRAGFRLSIAARPAGSARIMCRLMATAASSAGMHKPGRQYAQKTRETIDSISTHGDGCKRVGAGTGSRCRGRFRQPAR